MVSAEASRISQTKDETKWAVGEYSKPNKENGLILEIGASYWPVFTWSEAALDKVRGGFVYMNLENFQAASGLVKSTRVGEDVLGELSRAPIKSESANEIWVSNVFGLHGSPSDESHDYLKELSRLLKPDGIIYVVEWYTPSVWILLEEFQQYGLQKEEVFTDRDLLTFIERHGITKCVSKHLDADFTPFEEIPMKSFVLVLKKTQR